jgi:hypothetical protein
VIAFARVLDRDALPQADVDQAREFLNSIDALGLLQRLDAAVGA